MPLIKFSCELCGTERSEPLAWHKKRAHHFCSRLCSNRFNARKKATGLTRPEYEKQYWLKPENAARKKVMSKAAYTARMQAMGNSLKRAILNRAKARASISGALFDLSIEDFDIPATCPVLGFPLAVGDKQGGLFNSPSLDRMVPALGYVKGNVTVISKRANCIKSDASVDELRRVMIWVSSFQTENPQV